MRKILPFILLLCVITTFAYPSIQAESIEGPMLDRLNRSADHYGGGHDGHGGGHDGGHDGGNDSGHGSGHGSGRG